MPQKTTYSLRQRLYFGAVIAAGCALAAKSAAEIILAQLPSEWLVLGALTLLTGSFTIRIPRLSIRISVSDAFVFASVLLFDGSVATVIVAVDSVVATLWMRPENRSIFRSAFNLSVASLSIWTASAVFYWVAGTLPPPGKMVLTELLWPLFLLAAVYFLLNTWLIAIALGIEKTFLHREFPTAFGFVDARQCVLAARAVCFCNARFARRGASFEVRDPLLRLGY